MEIAHELPEVTSNITLRGDNREFRVSSYFYAFTVLNGNLTITNLRVTYQRPREDRVILAHGSRLIIEDSTFSNCAVGIYQENSRTTVRGASDICGLDADRMVVGGHTVEIDVTPSPPARTCDALPNSDAAVTALYGLQSGVQCRQVDAAGVGIQSVIDAGIIDAVDVWGYVGQGVDICFPQLGRITFLDAATAPRTVTPVETYRVGDMTCARLNRAGTVVLQPGEITTTTITTTTGSAIAESQPAPAPAPVTDGCPITTTGHLKHRSAPSLDAEIIGYVPRGSTLGVISRNTYWFQVSYQSQTGWIGGAYVAGTGVCS